MKLYMHFKPPPAYAEWTFVSKTTVVYVKEAVALFVGAYNTKFHAKLSSDSLDVHLQSTNQSLNKDKKLSRLLFDDTCELILTLRPSPPPASQTSHTIDTILALADKHKEKQAWRSARALWETILNELDPSNIAALQGMADLYMQSFQWVKAKQTINRMLSLVEATKQSSVAAPQHLLQRAKCELAMGHSTVAAETLQQILTPKQSLNLPLNREAKILLAEAMYKGSIASQEVAIALVREVLADSNESDLDAIALYSQIAHDRGKPAEAIQMILKVLVGRPQDKRVQAKCASFLNSPGGLEYLKQALDPSVDSTAAVYAYLATVTKDHGAMNACLACFRQAVKAAPHDTTYALNYVHALEVCAKYDEAFAFMKIFFDKNSDMAVESLSCASISYVLAEYTDLTDASGLWNDKSPPLTWKNSHVSVGSIHFGETKAIDLTPEQLDFIALVCTLVKVLFSQGYLRPLPALLALFEPVRYLYGHALHTTSIRNEHAYYCCISQLLCIPKLHIPSTLAPPQPVYVCGDSHTLATAWRSVSVHGQEHFLCPALVTGLKHWHLRKESNFYPKANFFNMVKTIPSGASVVFLFGEIDCREGILVAVEKCRYESIDEGMIRTISIFMDVLCDLVRTRGFRAYIHPIVPVLNETRHLVQLYNSHFKRLVDASSFCKWLDFYDVFLTSDNKVNILLPLFST
ncbi:unnamed protein product [Aphanomyces euteiches]